MKYFPGNPKKRKMEPITNRHTKQSKFPAEGNRDVSSFESNDDSDEVIKSKYRRVSKSFISSVLIH